MHFCSWYAPLTHYPHKREVIHTFIVYIFYICFLVTVIIPVQMWIRVVHVRQLIS